MGLDMYLNRVPKVKSIEELTQMETRINASQHAGDEINSITDEQNWIYTPSLNWDKYDKEWSLYPHYHTAYWRKFNALHKWFVDNVQNGVDDCEDYIVRLDNIQNLLLILEDLTPENCHERFPIQAGFFFGDYEYTEWYWNNVKTTIHICHYLITEINWNEEVLIYRSSW